MSRLMLLVKGLLVAAVAPGVPSVARVENQEWVT
jgi:hypothetical protein